MSPIRGKINNPKRAKQLHDFSGLRFKNITPTDIDGFVEFQDKLFVLMEAKAGGAPLPGGQRLAIERLCLAITQSGRTAVALILTHNIPPEQEIDFAKCIVVEYWRDGAWHKGKGGTCRVAIEYLLKQAGLDYSGVNCGYA